MPIYPSLLPIATSQFHIASDFFHICIAIAPSQCVKSYPYLPLPFPSHVPLAPSRFGKESRKASKKRVIEHLIYPIVFTPFLFFLVSLGLQEQGGGNGTPTCGTRGNETRSATAHIPGDLDLGPA